MKLRGLVVIFMLSVMGLAEVANGMCVVRNTTNPDYYWYQCFMSTDYWADLKKAPVDITGHSVVSSKIPVLKNGIFARFNKSLINLAIVHCGVEEIEDNAFQGLTQLVDLTIAGNKLEVIKSAWMKGLPKLFVLSLYNNRIKRVEDDFFATLPRRLNTLVISNNLLTCLPTASFGQFNVSELIFRNNRLTWKCQVELTEWLKKADIWDDSENDENMEPPYELAEICVSRLPQSRMNEKVLDKCVDDTTHDLLPFNGDYTVSQVCQFHESKPSPFLNCTKSE